MSSKPQPEYCSNYSAIAYADDGDTRKITRLRCKQWSCEYCAIKERDIWRAAIIDSVNRIGGKWSFLTLTLADYVHNLPSRFDRLAKSIEVIRSSWDKLVKRMKRKYGAFEYVRVIESHKDGTLHIHLLASFHHPNIKVVEQPDKKPYGYTRWLKKHVPACGFGYIMDVQNLGETVGEGDWHAGQVAGYVTKYMTKDLEDFDDVRRKSRFRKIQTSRGIKKINLESDLDWHVTSRLHVSGLTSGRIDWYDLNLQKTLEIIDFDASGYYPALDTTEFRDLKPFGMTRDDKTGRVRVLTDDD